jgi:hypothetical protein
MQGSHSIHYGGGMQRKTLVTIVLIWIGWFAALYAFQWLVTLRFDVRRPDYAVSWSEYETNAGDNERSVYLTEPILNGQTAWDSEYYLGIAVGGYDDPLGGRETNPRSGLTTPRNYSFFPLYPYAMAVLAFPLRLFDLNPIAAAALAGVVLSLLGTLAGMLALYDMTRTYLDEDGRLRALFYLLIFPSAFFLAQIYTEGVFIGLAFGSLALMKRKLWLGAAVLAALAAWTRAYGAALALPLAWCWLTSFDSKKLQLPALGRWLASGLSVLVPLGAYLLWRTSALGRGWAELNEFYFGRGLMSIDSSAASWRTGYEYALTNGPATVYFGIMVLTIAIAFLGSLALLRRDPAVALFSLAVVVLSVYSGSAQSLERYMLAAPAAFIVLAGLGSRRAFDRFWTVISLLLMGMSAALFTLEFWVG